MYDETVFDKPTLKPSVRVNWRLPTRHAKDEPALVGAGL
jgi:hypothetical protein